MNTNLFYFHTLNVIGGVETFFYQLVKKYGKTHDITIMYSNGDRQQVRRLSQYARVKKWCGEPIKCKRCFVAFNAYILDFVEAEEYIQMLHGDYKSLGVIPDRHEKINRYVAVSNVVHDAYKDITGDDPVVCYNPYTKEKPRKIIHLISATRLTPDKGAKRMEMLANALDAADIRYTWDVYSDMQAPFTNGNVRIREPRLDILDFIADADYYVQLSDAEGYCYSVVEALSVGTPVIVTDFKVAKEIGVEDGVNGFILPMDMSEIPIDAIKQGLKKFKYTPPPDRWDELLIKSPPDFEAILNEIVTVQCTHNFIDLERDKKLVQFGETWQCTLRRAEELMDINVVEIMGR